MNQVKQMNQMIREVPLLQMILKQRWNDSGEPGESNESGDLKGSFLCTCFWNKDGVKQR
jgi:hypothetical protein